MVIASFTAGTAGASSLLSNVPEAINYEIVYELDIPPTASFNGNPIPYSANNSASIVDGYFPRVAYYLELESGGATQWVYVSMDTFTTEADKLGVPKVGSGEFYNYAVTGPITNANILSNVGGLTTGNGIDTINIEFWPSNYGGGNDYGVPGANGSIFDFGDGGANTGNGYGSMQIHNYGAGQTLFAYNHWGNSVGEVGIGNQGTGNPDWTFSNALGTYTKKTLQILTYRGGLSWSSPGLSSVTMTSAVAHATLGVVGGSSADAWVYWDTSDGGTNAASWANTNTLGMVSTGLVENAVLSDLLPATAYTFRFYGTNSTTTNHGWSQAESFRSLAPGEWNGSADGLWGNPANWTGNNVPDGPSEVARFGGAGTGNIDLNGNVYTIDTIDFAGGNYVLMNSGAAVTLTSGALTQSAGANRLSANVTVTGTTEISDGTLTLDPADAFNSGSITLGGGTLEIDGPSPISAAHTNLLTHRGYNINSDALHNLHNNGGLMAATPYGSTTLTDGPAGRGLDFNNDLDFLDTGVISQADNYMNLFIGHFVPQQTGSHEFRIEQDDDVTSMWLDLDRDGLFEAPGGLGTGENIRGTGNDWGIKTHTLTNGLHYMFAVTHREGGGGSGVDVNIRTPSMGAEATIKPTDPAQAGLWRVVEFGNMDATNLPIRVTADSTLLVSSGQGGGAFGDVALNAGTLTAMAIDAAATLAFKRVAGGGDLAISGNGLALDTASSMGTLLAGGGCTVTGAAITASTLYDLEPALTIHNSLAGDAELHAGDADNNDGVIELLGTNTYTGLTRITRSVLRADEGVGLPADSRLVFYQNNRDQTCILETKGSFTRNVGRGDGEVFWENRGGGGGFAAKGGDLTIDLEGGTFLMWPDANRGFNSVDSLQFGSRSADSMVEVKNDIILDGSNRRIQTIDNTGTKTDVVRFSGSIFSGNNANWLRFHESSGNQFSPGDNFYSTLVELTGANRYAHQTVVEECTLYAVEGTGLPTDSLLRFEGNSDQRHAVLMSSGDLNREIGQGDGEVYWSARGGFAARGGKLTVTLEGGAQLDWGNADAGLNNQRLQLNSIHADDIVEITNPIDLNASERHIHVWENRDSKADLAILSGNIVGSNADTWLRKWETGLLWLRGTNTYSQRTFLDEGVIRIDGTNNLSPNSCFVFDQNNWNQPCALESKGNLTHFNIGPQDEAGAFSWDTVHGGFAAYGGPLTVNLENDVQINAAAIDTGFESHALMLGSWTANDMVDFQNDIFLDATIQRIQVFDNPDSENDRSVCSGDITISNWGDLEVGGDGTLELTGTTTIRNTRVYDTATLAFNGSHTGINEVYTQGYQSGGLGGTGTVSVAYRFDVRERGRLAPGSHGVGTLDVTVHGANGFRMYDRSTYEWELGPSGGDKVAVTGNLELRDGWELKLLSDGGTPLAADPYDLFTYTGIMTYNPPAIDTSGMPPEWDGSGVSVVHDRSGKRVYITGLFSSLAVANADPGNLTSTSAQLNGTLSCSGLVMDVWAYWGETDEGTDAGAWSNKVKVGTFTNEIDAAVSHTATGFQTNAQYYYTFRATNATHDLWAAPSESFHALGPPVVDNDGATAIAGGTATLRGSFNDHNRGTVTICWGLSDAGTNSVQDWDHADTIGVQSVEAFAAGISDAFYPLSYHYRCFATNAYGYDWGDPASSFTMDVKPFGHPDAPAGALGYWSFNDALDVGHDDSGNGNHGARIGEASHAAGGVFDGALTLDGTGDFLNCGDGIAIANKSFSLGFWTQRDGTGEDYAIGHTSVGGNNHQLHVGFRDADTFTFAFWANDMNYDDAGVIGDTANYHHWVCTYDANTRQQLLYLDGHTTPVDNETRSANFAGTGEFYIGTRLGDSAVNPCYDGQLDEVYVYDRTLSADDAAQLYSATTAVSLISIANAQTTERTLSTAKINATFDITNATYDVWAYWGTADAHADASAWASNAFLGTYTNVVATDVSYRVGGLSPASTGFCTFRLSNTVDSVWATPSTNIFAVAAPRVDNDGGAIADVGAATLRGNLTAGHVADVTIYWGRSDGGTNAGSWDGNVLLGDTLQGAFSGDVAAGYGFTYYYRCYATNAAGHDWADSTASFSPLMPPWIEFSTNALRHTGYHGQNNDNNMDLDGNGGLMALTPYGTAFLTVGPANRGLDFNDDGDFINTGAIANNDNYANLFLGYFNPPTSGTYGFRNAGDDDRAGIWLDLDRDGVFESGTPGLGSNRGEQFSWEDGGNKTAALTGGERYLVAFTHREGGGGSRCDFRFTMPGGAEAIIKPADAVQQGLWTYVSGSNAPLTGVVFDNDQVSDVSTDSVTMNGILSATGWAFDIYAYWGTTDGGPDVGNWDSNVLVGAYANYDGLLSYPLTGLPAATTHFYTFRASNDVADGWVTPGMLFQTLGTVDVTNSAPTDVSQSTATLNGELLAGGSGDATLYWGLNDGGRNHTAWANTNRLGTVVVGGFSDTVTVLAGGTYHYRCYVTNAFGDDWAPATETFTAPQAGVTLAMAIVREDSNFSPTNLPGCALWLDGGDASTVWQDVAGTVSAGDGDPVVRWDDKSGNAKHVSDTFHTPEYKASVGNLGGRGALYFDGDQLGRANDIGILGNADRTLITVWANAANSGANYQHVFHHGNGATDQAYGHSVYRAAGHIGNHYWGSGFNTPVIGSVAPTIAVSTWDGDGGTGANGLDSWWVNGTAVGANDRAALNTAGNQLLIGSRLNGPLEGIRGDVAEVIVYNRVLSDAELARIGFHLDWKYGLNTAYSDSYPVAVTETRGSFAVTAALSAPAISNVTVNFDFGTNAYGYVEGIRGSVFLTNVLNDTAINLDGASYAVSDSRVFTGDKANTILAMTEERDHNMLVTGEILNFNNFPLFDGNADNFATVLSGVIIPRTTGSHTFRGLCDDHAWMYIDLAGDGVWDNSDRVFTGDTFGSKTLTRGQPYNFIFLHREGGGGQNIGWWVTEPGGGEQPVNTTLQAGMWKHALPAASVSNDYTTSAASVVIPAGSLSSNITLTVVDDLDPEDDEAVVVGIASLVNATNGYPDIVAKALSSRDPKVTHNGGAANITGSSALLNGVFAMGDDAAVTLYWGDMDGGTNHAAWGTTVVVGTVNENAPFATRVTGLSAGEVYFYRCYATNSSNLAEDWADATTAFTTTAAAVWIDDLAVTEGDIGTVSAVFSLTSSAPSLVSFAVDYVTSNGTAEAGTDYGSASGTVVFAVGAMSTQVTVQITGDILFEHPPETFTVNLHNPTHCSIGNARATCTILDDDAAGYLADWCSHMKITVAGYGGNETLRNFPVLVRLAESIRDFDYDSFASATGGDLRFANAAGTGLLNHEIEEWDIGGESCVWVQILELPPGGTHIWAYWGNPAGTTAPAYTTDGATWSEGLLAVWHLAEQNGPGSITAPDSANDNDGTLQNMIPSANWVDGMIANALNFDPANDNRNVNVNSLGQNCGETTISFWARPTGGGDRSIFHTKQWVAGDLHYFLLNGDNTRFAVNNAQFNPGNNDYDSTATLPDDQWTHWTAVYSLSRKNVKTYKNGVQDSQRPFNGAQEIQYTHGLYIGANNGGNSREMNGRIDELRIGNVTRSADWVMACYSNQVQGSSFVIYSDVVSPKGTLLIVR